MGIWRSCALQKCVLGAGGIGGANHNSCVVLPWLVRFLLSCCFVWQGNLEAICREISKAVNDQFEHMTLVIRFAAMGYRDDGDSQKFFKCGFIERPAPASREAALKANTDDANRVSAWVSVCFELFFIRVANVASLSLGFFFDIDISVCVLDLLCSCDA